MWKRAIAIALVALSPSEAIPDEPESPIQEEVCDTIPAAVRSLAERHNVSLMDAAREFVYANSEHADGDAFVTSTDPFENVDRLCRVAEGRATKPQLLCGHRAQALQSILSEMGIWTRTVYLFSEWDGPQMLYGHAFIEALDPVTGQWQVQDPDYNVAYENERGRRLSIAEIVAHSDREMIRPVNVSSEGWDGTGTLPLIDGNYYSVAFVPASGMLYYDRVGGETGLVTRVGEYIHKEMPRRHFSAALVGSDTK